MIESGTTSNGQASPRGSLVLTLVLLSSLTAGCVTTTYPPEVEIEVSEARATRDLGVDYLSSGRTGMAIRELTRSYELDPSDAQTHLWLGEAFRRKGKTDVAEEYLSEAVALARKQRDSVTEQQARLNLSALLSQLGRYEESIEHCEVLSDDPTISTPWLPLTNCGWARMKLGQLEAAGKDFREALSFFPRYGPALLNLGILEAKLGRPLPAIGALEKALASGRLSQSGHAEANYRLGELYVGLGRRDKAVGHFREAAKIAPDADWGSQSQAYLDLLR